LKIDLDEQVLGYLKQNLIKAYIDNKTIFSFKDLPNTSVHEFSRKIQKIHLKILEETEPITLKSYSSIQKLPNTLTLEEKELFNTVNKAQNETKLKKQQEEKQINMKEKSQKLKPKISTEKYSLRKTKKPNSPDLNYEGSSKPKTKDICGCGRQYQSYRALWTHIRNNHAGKLQEGTTTFNPNGFTRKQYKDSN